MKKTFSYIALAMILTFTFGNFQGIQAATEIQKKDSVYAMVDTPPTFVGGEAAMYKYLSETLVYPVLAQENNIQGRVIVQFVVDEKGKAIDPRVVRGIDPSLDNEAIRVIKAMPAWNPGLLKGKAVKVRYTIPIDFKLNDNQPKTDLNKQAEKPVNVDDGKQHIATSKGLVGFWRLLGIVNNNGTLVEVHTTDHKVINADGTFYTFIAWGGTKPTKIGLYGIYTITSDSTYTEKIIESGLHPRFTGTTSELRYKLIDENTLLLEFKNETSNVWVPEIWRRVEMADHINIERKTI